MSHALESAIATSLSCVAFLAALVKNNSIVIFLLASPALPAHLPFRVVPSGWSRDEQPGNAGTQKQLVFCKP